MIDTIAAQNIIHDFSVLFAGMVIVVAVAYIACERMKLNRSGWNTNIPREYEHDETSTGLSQMPRVFEVDCDEWDFPEGEEACWQY